MVDFKKTNTLNGVAEEMITDMNASEEFEDDVFEDDIDISDVGHYDELVTFIPEETLTEMASDILQDIAEDINSRVTWENTLTTGMRNLGISGRGNEATPFEGACTAHHPLILESCVKFQSKASSEMLPPDGPVKTKVFGDATEEIIQIANRIKTRLNYQTTEEMREYFPETEKALFCTALLGDAFKKKYFSVELNRVYDEMVLPTRLIVNNCYSSLEAADRFTHILYKTENEMEIDFYNGVFPEVDLGDPCSPSLSPLEEEVNRIMGVSTIGDCYTLYEHHCYLTLDNPLSPTETPRPLPYIVVIDKESETILSIKRNWDEDSKTFKRNEYFSHYSFIPWIGFLSLGYIQLLGNWQQTLTAITRSLVDAGQFANMPAGFKSSNFKVPGGTKALQPGVFMDVDAFNGDISKGIMALPFKEPSAVLFNILEFLDAKGEKFASSTDRIAESGSNYGPVGTTLALLDASGKTEAAIHKRLHNAQKKELNIIFSLDKKFDDNEVVNPNTNEVMATQADYKTQGIEIVPVSDPNISSQAHKLAIAQAKLTIATQHQGSINPTPLLREVYALLDTSPQTLEQMFPQPAQAQPLDPISDILAASKGQPIAAFPGQNHDAHIAIKQNWVNDPRNGGNPMMASVKEIVMANIREHMTMQYQEQMAGLVAAQQPEEGNYEFASMLASQEVLEYNMANEYEGTPDEILAKAEKEKVENERAKIESKNSLDNKRLILDLFQTLSKSEIDTAELELEMQKFVVETGKSADEFMINKLVELAKQNKNDKSQIDTITLG